jgi:hypothetical protein
MFLMEQIYRSTLPVFMIAVSKGFDFNQPLLPGGTKLF